MLYLALLYAALCDPHFDRREAATARLSHLIDRHPALYGPVLGDWCRGATCPEVRSRALPGDNGAAGAGDDPRGRDVGRLRPIGRPHVGS